MKFYIVITLLFLCISIRIFSQDKPSNPEALELFIEGKTLELQNNYIGAIQKYEEALKIEKAAGIYFTISKLYSELLKYDDNSKSRQKALDAGLNALEMDSGNVNYKENIADIYNLLGDYEKALNYLQQVSQKKPDDINLLYYIGRLYEALKKPMEAVKYYEKITDDYQYDETVLQRMIKIYDSYHDFANEAATMEKLLFLSPSNMQLKFALAETYLKVPDYDNASRIYDEILKIDPSNSEALKEVVRLYFRQNKTDLAFEKYGKLIDKDTIDFNSKMQIALAFYYASQEDSTNLPVSKSIFENLRTAYPEQWEPIFYIALINEQTNHTSPEETFNKVLAIADTSAEAHVQVGFYYYVKNKLEEALKIFNNGVDKFPNDFRLNFFMGNTYYRMGKQIDALPYLEKAYKVSPSDMNTISTLGIIYDNLYMDNECEKLYGEALKIYPDNILLLNNFAYHLAERNKSLKEALEMSKVTIEKEPENSSYLDTYGWIYYKLKDYKKAQQYIQKAISIQANATLYEHLGDVYYAQGETDAAINCWKKSLELEPDNKEVLKKLEKGK